MTPGSTALHHGDVVLVPFPFADLSGQKVRPAVVVSSDPQQDELIVAFVTSVLTNRSPRGADFELLRAHAEFGRMGLKADSIIRLDKLVTLERRMIVRRLGRAGPAIRQQLIAKLRATFGL